MIGCFQAELRRIDSRIDSTRQYMMMSGNHKLGMILLARLKCRRQAVLVLLRSYRLECRLRVG